MTATSRRRLVARLFARIWFRTMEREGEEPTAGAVVWVFNHPNALLDPLVGYALLQRPPRLLAKATLWESAVLRPFLRVFDPIPVKRHQDGAVGPEDTKRTFAAVHDALARGDVIGLFPEGISHAGDDLAKLKTGAARIVLSCSTRPLLVPAGLVYGERQSFRHGVLLRIGEPIAWDDLADRGAEPEAVTELTMRVAAALYPLTLLAPDVQARQLAEDLAWLLAEGPRERVSLERLRARVQGLLPRLRGLSDAQRESIAARVAEVHAQLSRAGVRADQVGFRYTPPVVARWLPGFLARVAVAPFVLAAGLMFWPSYRIAGIAAVRLAVDLDVHATYKFLFGLVILPATLIVFSVAAGLAWGWLGVTLVLVSALAAVLSVPLFERLREDVQAIRGFFARSDPSVPRLLSERERLLDAFPELRAWAE